MVSFLPNSNILFPSYFISLYSLEVRRQEIIYDFISAKFYYSIIFKKLNFGN